jgi:hypothetical protein
VADPTNWGSTQAGHPCAERSLLIHVTGDLTLRGGEAAGVLVVDGDLVATDGFTLHGLLVVRGRVLLDDATIVGALRSRTLDLRDGAILYDSCLLGAAVEAPAFDRPFRLPGRWWVPTF